MSRIPNIFVLNQNAHQIHSHIMKEIDFKNHFTVERETQIVST